MFEAAQQYEEIEEALEFQRTINQETTETTTQAVENATVQDVVNPVNTEENDNTQQDGTEQAGLIDAVATSTLSRDEIEDQQLARLGHQETTWILQEIEGICESAPEEFLRCDYVLPMLIGVLGYEDMDEFEDAIKGSFEVFLQHMPHFETEFNEEANVLTFRMAPEEPEEPRQLLIPVTSIADLYKVVLKPADAQVLIPELEFYIMESQEKQINTIWNHLASSIFNLGLEAKQGTWDDNTVNRVTDTLLALNRLLDVEDPWTFIVKDPSGLARVKQTFSLDKLQHHARVPVGSDNDSEKAFATAFGFDAGRNRLIVAMSSRKLVIFDIEAQMLVQDISCVVNLPPKAVPAGVRICGIVAPPTGQGKLLLWGPNFMTRLEMRPRPSGDQDSEQPNKKQRKKSESKGEGSAGGETLLVWAPYEDMRHIVSLHPLEQSQWGSPVLPGPKKAPEGSAQATGKKRKICVQDRAMVLTMEVAPSALEASLPQVFERKAFKEKAEKARR